MAEQIITKQCYKCKRIKSLSEFYTDRSKKDGHRTHCKKCCLAYNKTIEHKIIRKRYEQSEKGRANQKRCRQSKKGKVSMKHYQQSEKGKANQKRYFQSEKGKAYRRNKYKRQCKRCPEKMKTRNAITSAVQRDKIPSASSLQCYYCNAKAEEYHHPNGYNIEHRFDVVPICRICHSKIHRVSVIRA